MTRGEVYALITQRIILFRQGLEESGIQKWLGYFEQFVSDR